MTNPLKAVDPEDRLQEAVLSYLKSGDSGQPLDAKTLLERYADVSTQLQAFFEDEASLTLLLTPLAACPTPEHPARTLNRAFGRYELITEVGRGGMGIVYKARQQGVDRLVALKIVRAGTVASVADLERFRNETQTIAGLDHPHIVPVYDVGEHDGQLYYTMPLLEGGSLVRKLPQFHDDPRRAAGLVATIARAVHHAHQRGVLHRDIKPSNILLDDAGRPFIADFGLAKRLDADTSLTETGAVLGTPGYMSPEQALGRSREITTSSDIYGLGAILYTLLTGRPPFRGATVLATLNDVRQREPDSISAQNPRVDRDLSAICLKCLEKSPDGRYVSAESLADDLDRWLAGVPIQARHVGPLSRAWRWSRRNPLVAGMATALSLLVVVGLISSTVGYVLVSRARDDAQRTAAYLRTRVYAADIRRAYSLWQRGEIQACQQVLASYIPTGDTEDLRGFEWRYVQSLCESMPREQLCYRGHQGVVFHATFSPDGRTVASGGSDFEIHLWDSLTGASRGMIRGQEENPHGHSADVNWLAFSPDGKVLASAGEDSVIRLWDPATLEPLGVLAAHQGPVECIDFSPDGSTLVSGGADGVARVWNVGQRKVTRELQHQVYNNIESLDVSSDGATLVTGSFDGTIRVWDLVSGEERVKVPRSSASRMRGVALSPDGASIHAIGDSGAAAVFNSRTGEQRRTTARHSATGRGVCYAPNGQWLASCGDFGWVYLHSSAREQLVASLPARQGQIWSVSSSPDSRRLLTTGSDQTVEVWQLHHEEAAQSVPVELSEFASAAWAADSRTLAISQRQVSGEIGFVVWDVPGRRALDSVLHQEPGNAPLAWSPDGQSLAYSWKSGEVCLWDRTSRQSRTLLEPLEPPPGGWPLAGQVGRLIFTSSGESLCIAYLDGSLRVYDFGKRTDRVERNLNREWMTGLARLDDEKIVLPTIQRIRIWNLAQWRWEPGEYVAPLPDDIAGIAVAPDGVQLAVGLVGGSIHLLDSATLRVQQSLPGHQGAVSCLAYSADGKTLASGGDDTARLWHVPSGQELFVFEHRRDRGICSLDFSPDGATLAIGVQSLLGENTVSLYHANHVKPPTLPQ